MLEASTLNPPATAHVELAPQRAIVSIAAFKTTEAALHQAATLPVTPHFVLGNNVMFLWSGRSTWLAVSEDPDLEARILRAAMGLAAITDQSDGRAILRVTAPAAKLQKLVPIDLHESAFGPNATALTLAGHIPIQIWRTADGFDLCCFRSFAESLYHSLVEACEV
jgi:sarcosine oxidase subunit gamma